MPALVDHQRQLARDAYGEFCVQNLQRLGTADSEYVRLNALKQLARIVGIVSLLPQIHDLAAHTRSEWISFQATIVIANYLQLFSDAAADNRPEPLNLDLAEQLAVQQQLEEERANLPPIDPDDLAYYRSALSDPPQPTQQLPADAASDDETDDASDEEADADQPTVAADQPTATDADQPNDHTDQPEPAAPNLDQPEAIEHLFEQAEQLADRLASQPDPDLNLDPPT